MKRCEVNRALNSSVRMVRLTPTDQFSLPREFLRDAREIIQDTVNLLLKECTECKVNVVLCVQISRLNDDGITSVTEPFYFSVEARTLDEFFIDDIIAIIESKVAFFMNRGSNWQIDGVKHLDLHITRYTSLRQVAGRSNFQSIELPPSLSSKHAVVNVHNPGPDCFKYALLSVLHYPDVKKDRQRPAKYSEWLDEHKWQGKFIILKSPLLSLY